jgi:hypothetical protein
MFEPSAPPLKVCVPEMGMAGGTSVASTPTRLEPCSSTFVTNPAALTSIDRLRKISLAPVVLSLIDKLEPSPPAAGKSIVTSRLLPQVPTLAARNGNPPTVPRAAAAPAPQIRTIKASVPPFWKNCATA